MHAIKFQSVVSPNGIIANLYGPIGKFVFSRIEFGIYFVNCAIVVFLEGSI